MNFVPFSNNCECKLRDKLMLMFNVKLLIVPEDLLNAPRIDVDTTEHQALDPCNSEIV